MEKKMNRYEKGMNKYRKGMKTNEKGMGRYEQAWKGTDRYENVWQGMKRHENVWKGIRRYEKGIYKKYSEIFLPHKVQKFTRDRFGLNYQICVLMYEKHFFKYMSSRKIFLKNNFVRKFIA